ncbi:hypothetical protein LXL04_000248 [Taraxacum kok-saghyz]
MYFNASATTRIGSKNTKPHSGHSSFKLAAILTRLASDFDFDKAAILILTSICSISVNVDEVDTEFQLLSDRILKLNQDFANYSIINIALTNRCHYVKVDLQEGHPLANVSWLWNMHKSARSIGWQTLYQARLNAYVPPYRPTNRHTTTYNISDETAIVLKKASELYIAKDEI